MPTTLSMLSTGEIELLTPAMARRSENAVELGPLSLAHLATSQSISDTKEAHGFDLPLTVSMYCMCAGSLEDGAGQMVSPACPGNRSIYIGMSFNELEAVGAA